MIRRVGFKMLRGRNGTGGKGHVLWMVTQSETFKLKRKIKKKPRLKNTSGAKFCELVLLGLCLAGFW